MKKINLPWGCQTRVDLVDKSLLRHFAESGCKQIDFGVESGSDRILKVMRKNVSRRDIINAFKATRESGLRSFATITIGHPTETVDDLEKTVSLLKIIKPNFTLTSYLTPLPGTYSYHWGVKNRKITSTYYKNMNYHFHAADKPYVNISDVPDNVLIEYKKKIDRLTFKWNYLSMVNLHNFRYLLSMIYYNITDIKSFKNLVKEFYKTKNIDKTITKLLYNYQQKLVKNSV